MLMNADFSEARYIGEFPATLTTGMYIENSKISEKYQCFFTGKSRLYFHIHFLFLYRRYIPTFDTCRMVVSIDHIFYSVLL